MRSTIFYMEAPTDVDTIFAARVQLEPSFRVRETEVVYVAPSIEIFDVHPDGTHLIVAGRQQFVAMATDDPDAPGKVVVVLNWFEELRQRLGN